MASFELLFQGKTFPVPKKSVLEFLVNRRDLLDAKSYNVESSVSPNVFEEFVDSLRNQRKIGVTKDKVKSLLLLAKEFCFEDLEKECLALLPPDANLSDRICKLEMKFEEQISSQERRLESLRLEVENLKKLFANPPNTSNPVSSQPTATPQPPSSTPHKTQNQLEFPMKQARLLDGIISYLTKKHGGNVHEKGIVTITSKSVVDDPNYALKNVADLTAISRFRSKKDELGQWICWDFHEMRLCPTNYTIKTNFLKSWVVEGSLDGQNWTEIDGQSNDQVFPYLTTVSFTVSNPMECRFIRLTQTDKNHLGDGELRLTSVEFFGALSE
jgi:hypothetical protein